MMKYITLMFIFLYQYCISQDSLEFRVRDWHTRIAIPDVEITVTRYNYRVKSDSTGLATIPADRNDSFVNIMLTHDKYLFQFDQVYSHTKSIYLIELKKATRKQKRRYLNII